MALSKNTRRWLGNALKLLITVLGFYVLLTHEVSTWVKGDADLWAVPVQGEVTSVEVQGVPLPAVSVTDLVEEGSVGWALDGDLLKVRLHNGGNPARAGLAVPGQSELGRLPIARAIADYVQKVDGKTFVFWSLVAMGVKFVGVIASAGAWSLLLRGQGLRFPFWQQIMTAFLIGRFIGTFLPSTIGLDAYTLFEAGRYSDQWHRAITAKALEKFLGFAGLVIGLLVALPAGYFVLVDALGGTAVVVVLGVGLGGSAFIAAVVVGLVFPQLYRWVLVIAQQFLPGVVRGHAGRFVDAATAYQGKHGVVFGALFLKFVTHFTTAMVYFFTALAIGVVGVSFLPIVFGSLIQILGTLLSPTIAGEGAREAIQALLLSNYLGGAAQAVLSAALGFVAAEAATMWGGAFLWTRTAKWRPTFVTVDGEQVDYSWLSPDDDGSFDADAIQRVRGIDPTR